MQCLFLIFWLILFVSKSNVMSFSNVADQKAIRQSAMNLEPLRRLSLIHSRSTTRRMICVVVGKTTKKGWFVLSFGLFDFLIDSFITVILFFMFILNL